MPEFGWGMSRPARPKSVPTPSVALPDDWMQQAGSITDPAAWHRLKAEITRAGQYHTGGREALYGNPLASQFDTETGGNTGLWGRIQNSYNTTPLASREGRIAMAKIAAFVGGASALGAASGGAGAGAGGGGGFVAGGGPSLANPSSGWLARGLLGKLGGGGGGSMDWGELLKGGIGTVLGKVLNRQDAPGKDLSRSPFESGDLQRYLPPSLRSGETEPLIGAGIQGIGELLRNPGGLSPTVADAIRPRLTQESQAISQNYRGIGSNQAGAAARSNMPTSIKGALQSALDVAQERAQRGARSEALAQSDTMRRADLERVFQILDAILQFQQAGRGTATAGLGPGTALQSQQNASMMALIGNLLANQKQAGA